MRVLVTGGGGFVGSNVSIIHAAIWNDPTMLSCDRRRAWRECVGTMLPDLDRTPARLGHDLEHLTAGSPA